MNTPIWDFVHNYSKKNDIRAHMPGHKGYAPYYNDCLDKLYYFDITEIRNADSLFESNGIIRESEKNASALYNTYETFYCVSGSTLCIQAMLCMMKFEGRKIIAARNSHRAFLNACILLGLDVDWIYPSFQKSILSGEILLEDIENALKSCDSPSCVYITSPDYLGKIYDIKGIADICHKYNAPLLVDNAHGAHLAFRKENRHPCALGADMCCDSAHKMLPAMTGAAYLHIKNKEYVDKAKSAMSLFASTSPSYPIMVSLDLCNRYIDENIRDDIAYGEKRIAHIKKTLADKFSFIGDDAFHLTITGQNFNGDEFSDKMRAFGIECEYSDISCTVLLMSPCSKTSDYDQLEFALRNVDTDFKKPCRDTKLCLPHLERVMSIRDAALGAFEEVDVENSLGRIVANVKVPCPPAVPIAVSGERINEDCINILKRYSIFRINVVK